LVAGSRGGSVEGEVEEWLRRFREETIGEIVAPYVRDGLVLKSGIVNHFCVHHQKILANFNLDTRAVAGQVFRRIVMADEFLLRYLTNVNG